MKLIALFASALLSSPMAFAEVQDVDTVADQVIEIENGAMSQDATDALTPPQISLQRNGRNTAELIGVIGAIAADQIGFDRPGRGGRGGRGGPGDDGWGGGPGGGGWNRDFVCYARDARGNLYRAIGPNPRRVQDRAMLKCQSNARFCRPQGCQRI